MRKYIGLAETEDFVDVQIASQLQWLDDNGMYRDPNEPMQYDSVTRGLFAVLLHFGYKGKYFKEMDDCLRQAGLLSLQMQSVSGEIAFGGRSNQFMHNEAWQTIVYEYEAKRYKKSGDLTLAAKFKAAAERALDNVAYWFAKRPIHHIKNRFPLESKYGCESYAYFDKYMITAASFLHEAYLICDESIQADTAEPEAAAFQSSGYFHAAFLRAGGYALQFDTAADTHYDATGLGRVHRKGAPSTVCLSVPCPTTPNFVVDIPPRALSLCAGVRDGDAWHFVCDGDAAYTLTALRAEGESAAAALQANFKNGTQITEHDTVSENGVQITLQGEGEIAYLLPALAFDGEARTEICAEESTLSISLDGWQCRYITNGKIVDLGFTAPNRNGHYRAFAATGKDALCVSIEILCKGG
jgi:hypothetical protein